MEKESNFRENNEKMRNMDVFENGELDIAKSIADLLQ